MVTSLVSSLVLMVAAQYVPSPPVDDAVTRERMDQMLAGGEESLIVATFRRHPQKVLPYFDQYLEGGLKIIEDGGSEESAKKMMRLGVTFATLASEAFGDEVFIEYASAFASWSPQEQRLFREGQREYGVGRKMTDDPKAAIAHFMRSYELARSLRDTWGEAMAAGGLARSYASMDDHINAVRYGRVASTTYRRLQLKDNEIDMVLLCGRTLEASGDRRGGVKDLYRAWVLIQERKGDPKREEILRELITAMERVGQDGEAEALRQELEGEPVAPVNEVQR